MKKEVKFILIFAVFVVCCIGSFFAGRFLRPSDFSSADSVEKEKNEPTKYPDYIWADITEINDNGFIYLSASDMNEINYRKGNYFISLDGVTELWKEGAEYTRLDFEDFKAGDRILVYFYPSGNEDLLLYDSDGKGVPINLGTVEKVVLC